MLGSLIKNPQLLNESKYKLERDDFVSESESSFYLIIFAAITNLLEDGAEKLDVLAIDSFLSSYNRQYEIFNQNNGIEYLENAIENAKEENFNYYYNRLKKFSLLREYSKQGFDTKDIYDDMILNPREQEEMMQKFDEMSVKDIIDHFEKKQIHIKNRFMVNDKVVTEKAGKNSKELLQKFKEEPDYGISLIGDIQNTLFRGAKTKTIDMRSAPSNLGKTRISLAEATDMAIDEWYDLDKKEWVKKGSKENVLFISTEMERDRLEPTMWAYISGVAEEKIKDGDFNEEEEKRLNRAIEVLERSGLWIDYIPDFDTNLIESKIKQHIIENDISYCYFDYVHISTSIMEELANQGRGVRLREDMVLFMFVDRLEKITKEHDVWLRTASQVNGTWKDAETADSTMLRGAKNMADRLDRGIIMLSPTKKELEQIQPILDASGFPRMPEPNVVYHIYKNRETKYKDCKLWLHIDYDTMRQTELFLTDNNQKVMKIQPTVIDVEEAEENKKHVF